MTTVSVSFSGTAEEASIAMEQLREAIEAHDGRLTVEDPAALAAGGGHIDLEFGDLEPEDARPFVEEALSGLPAEAGECGITAVH